MKHAAGRTCALAVVCAVAASCGGPTARAEEGDAPADAPAAVVAPAEPETPPTAVVAPTGPAAVPTAIAAAADGGRPANELGRIPILEYHLIGETEGRWQRSVARFREDLALLYARGYRPITVRELVTKRIDLPAGLSPVVVTFDDASPGQFRYIERGDSLAIDPASAVGMWLEMNRSHPDWGNKAVFCMLSGAEAGRALFGDRGIEGQKTAWRHAKVRQLAGLGFELCNHTLWHANLATLEAAAVQEQIARLQLAVDSVLPGYEIRTFALPLGEWPKDRALAARGRWTDPKSGRTVEYEHEAVLLVAGGPARSPHDPAFDPLRLPRVQVFADELETVLDRLDQRGERYVSDGDPSRVTAPAVTRPAVTDRL